MLYQRAVGYFCVNSISCILEGIDGLLENNGKIQLITSPQLSEDDMKQIESGYNEREQLKFVETKLLKSLEDLNDTEKQKLSIVSILIKYGILDIKIALKKHGIYHDKIGIVHDNFGNSILFSGSMNETRCGFLSNDEHFDVLKSWDSHDVFKIKDEISIFENTWLNKREDVISLDFPEAVKEKCLKFLPSNMDIKESPIFQKISKRIKKLDNSLNELFSLPSYFEIRDYQSKAIENWVKNKYVGIFDMATGTGKTLTALSALHVLYENNNNRLAIIIVCPYQHLVEQWAEELENCGVNPIVGYSTSKQRCWKKYIKQEILSYLSQGSNFFCFITTNSTFVTADVQAEISKITNDIVLVVDEAHNIGAMTYRKFLPSNIPYRLALSATVDRHNDEEGTRAIFDYFDKKCIEYTLKDAIDNKMLTPYNYYPEVVYLSDEELDEYVELTKKVLKLIAINNKKSELSKQATILLNKRARLVAGAIGKLDKLKEIIKPYVNKKHILVYCGASQINDLASTEINSENKFGIKQIDAVTQLLGKDLKFKVGRFTSKEDAQERKRITSLFTDGDNMQVLVAIKCLDEGVNIPCIQTAFIMASSTNPKEYIQRRGRVLRKFKGKSIAEIYDFITLPNNESRLWNESIKNSCKGLITRELKRIQEFSSLSQNPSKSYELVSKLLGMYDFSSYENKEIL